MPADGVKGLDAQVVFDLAGVLARGLRADAETDQQFGEEFVPLVDALGDLQARLQQHDHPRRVQADVAALAQALGGIADAGLGHAQLFRHVDGADVAALFLEHQHGFQIVFGRFVNVHVHHPL